MSEDRLSPPWQKKLLGEVATCILGGTPSTEIPQFWDGNIPWMASGDVNLRRVHDVSGRITEAGLASSNATMTEPPAVAVGLAGQGKTRGTVALTLRRLCTNQSIALLKGDERNLLTEFLFHDLDRRYEELRARSSGGGRGGLSKGILVKVPMTLPSVPEQSKIAEILDTLDAAIRETEAVVAKLKAMKQGLLHDLLACGIDASGDLRPPQPEAPHLYKQTPLGWLPKEWEPPFLDYVARRGSGHTPSKSIASYWNGGIRWVSLADSHRLDQVYIFETDKEISEAGIANSSAVRHPENTVILSRDAGIGKSAILASEMAVSQHFMAWKCGAKLNHTFLYYVLQRAKPKFEAIAMGSTIKTIGLSFFKKYRIALPPIEEQRQSAYVLSQAEGDITRHAQELAKLKHLKSGLMDDLLTGRVPVTPLL